jgi:hypothetical protein
LANGDPVRATATELAAMGVISQSTAQQLAAMQENGAGASQVFAALTGELAKAQGAMETQAKTVDGVTAAYEKSRAALEQKFGEPFKEAEIQRLQDATAAINAVSGPVEKLAQFLNGLLSPVENLGTSFAGWLSKLDALTTACGLVVTAVKGLTVGLIALTVGLSVKPLGIFVASLFGAAAATGKTRAAFAALGATECVGAGGRRRRSVGPAHLGGGTATEFAGADAGDASTDCGVGGRRRDYAAGCGGNLLAD